MTAEPKYWAFISYSHADKKWGNWLHGALETYKVPRSLAGGQTGLGEPMPQRLFPIFRDREELPTSSDLGTMISQALQQSRYLIVICSPRAAHSHWVNQEILDFKRLGKANRILALIVDGEPNAADGKSGFGVEAECFPQALKYALGADGNPDQTQPAEPIAADARPHMDGRTNARLKLVAGVLGVNYDDLKRREERRRRRQQSIVVAVAAALVLTFATLAGYALWLRGVAQHQTVLANDREQQAEDQKRIADEKTVEANNEKDQVETQTAADDEDLGREALLRGDQLMAAQPLSLAYQLRSGDPSVRVMLNEAMIGLDGLMAVLRGNAGNFTDLQVAPAGGLVLTKSIDGEAQVWNPANGQAVATFGKSGNENNVIRAAAFTPDGKRVLFVNGTEAYLQDLATGRRIPLPAGKGASFVSAALSSDGGTVIGAVWKYDGKNFTTQIVAFGAADGHEISRVEIPDEYAILGSPGSGARAVLIGGPANMGPQDPARKVLTVETQTGKIVAEIPVGLYDNALASPRGDFVLVNYAPPSQAPPAVYSAQTGAKVAVLSANGVTASTASWSPSGRYIISQSFVSRGANGALWDVLSWKPVHVWPNEAWSSTTIDHAESHLASVTGQGEIEVWDLHSGALLRDFSDEICAGNLLGAASAEFAQMRFSPDGRQLAYTGGGTCASVWNWDETHRPEVVLSAGTASVNSIAFSNDGKRAVTGGAGIATIWNAGTGAAQFALKSKDNPAGATVPMALFTPDGKEVITGGSFQDAALWNASNGSLIRQLTFDKHAIVFGDTVRIGVSRTGNRAVTFSGNGWGALWDLKTRKQIATLHTEDSAAVQGPTVVAMSFASDGSQFVVADASGFAFVFDALKGTLKRKLGKQGKPLVAAEIAPRNDKVLTADSSGHIVVWSLEDGRALININTAAGAPAVNDAHFSQDGETIIAACADSKVRTWDASTGKPELTVAEETLPGDMTAIMPAPSYIPGRAALSGMLRVLYSPDGSFFAGTNDRGHVMVWDAKTGKQLLRFEGPTVRVTSLAFSPDGSLLGSSSEDGTARIWDVSLEKQSPADIERALAVIRQKPSQ